MSKPAVARLAVMGALAALAVVVARVPLAGGIPMACRPPVAVAGAVTAVLVDPAAMAVVGDWHRMCS
jgi:hypothetical protein